MANSSVSRMGKGEREFFSLPADLLARVFPFFFVFDRNWRLVDAGPSFWKLFPDLSAEFDLRRAFELSSPRIDWDFEIWGEHADQVFVLRLPDSQVVLRGQLSHVRRSDQLLFLGGPWGPDAEALSRLGLTVSDFANHDATLDHLMILQANRRTVQDAQETLERLSEERRLREDLEKNERALEHDLNASGDIRIRLDQSSRVVELITKGVVREIATGDQACGRVLSEIHPALALRLTERLPDEAEDAWAFEMGLGPEEAAPYFAFRVARTLAGEILAVGRDVTDRRRLEDELRRRALHDPLTGLANRSFLEEQVRGRRNRSGAASDGSVLALLVLDLDGFKSINDSHGHIVGDDLLVEVASRMEGSVREGDLCARLGGDEFAILLPELSHPDQAWEVAIRLLENLARPMLIQGIDLRAGASVGVVVDEDDVEFEVLLRKADLALYRAKAKGKGRAELFHSSLQDRAIRRAALKKGIGQGMERGEFVLEYQPVVDLATREMVGVEALARWRHPDFGLVGPFEFIEIAEESGEIVALGRHILENALIEKAAWDAASSGPPIDLAVNLSRKQLLDEDLLRFVEERFAAHGVNPQEVTFEVTEGLVMRDRDRSVATLEALRRLGTRIAMDDFGRDYSSLSELEALPIDILKVDKIFVDRLNEGEAWPLTETIVALGQALGLTVIAEGIETPRQLEVLERMHCKLGQGYLFARPESAAQILRRLGAAQGEPVRMEFARKPEDAEPSS